MFNKMKRLVLKGELGARFSRYVLVGSFNTVLDIMLYFIFANVLSLFAVVSSLLSTSISMCVSFFLNHRYVFKSGKTKRRSATQFVVVNLFNVWGVQSLIIYLFIHFASNSSLFDKHHWTLNLIAKLLAVGVSFTLNFYMYHTVFDIKIFEKKSEEING